MKTDRDRQGHENEDDCGDSRDSAERRKRQNRLHQRAWRRRKAAQMVLDLGGQDATDLEDAGRKNTASAGPFGVLIPMSSKQSLDVLREHGQVLALSHQPTSSRTGRTSPPVPPEGCEGAGVARVKGQVIPPLIPYIRDTRDLSTIGPVLFPISLDHRLITLIQYNVLRAMLINMSIMSLMHVIPEECGGAFALLRIPPPLGVIPPSLRPTLLQQTAPHPGWIGAVPDRSMRDNLILNSGKFDEDDLCCDLIGGLYEGFDEVDRRGLIAWSDPWSPDGWEITEGFAKKWKFLLTGCAELLASTNRWRARRGEDPLLVEI